MSKLKQLLFSLNETDRRVIEEKLKEKYQQIDQLKQQLKDKDKEIKSLIADYEKRISQEQELMSNMEQQLAEKQKTIDEINKEFVQAIHDWKTLCAEKDKEIERLKNLFELNNEVVINQGKEIFDLRVQVLQQKQNQTQLAINELEKVKMVAGDLLEKFCSSWEYHQKYMRGHRHIEYYDLIQGIDNQIKKLKGEHDE